MEENIWQSKINVGFVFPIVAFASSVVTEGRAQPVGQSRLTLSVQPSTFTV